MPAEWSRHERTWMMWPCRTEVWDDLDATRRNYASVVHAIREFEPVSMAVRPEHYREARAMLSADVDVVIADIDDSWARDAGPCFVKHADGRRAGVCFDFNAWGRKYEPYAADARFSRFVSEAARVPAFASPLVAEGGGISVDGDGTILTTETCFPNRNRNPGWSQISIELELLDMLGGNKVVWLPGNPLETETDGHTDGIAVFAGPGIVLMERPSDHGSEWDRYLQQNLDAMRDQTDAQARPIRIVTVPAALDAPSTHPRFCRSYVNFYFVNGGVVLPSYGVDSDDEVRDVFSKLFPDRALRPVRIDHIAVGGGGIHCITQQQPA